MDTKQLARRHQVDVGVVTVLTGFGVAAIVAVFWYLVVAGHPQYDACVERGVTHFREIGSYPRLKAYPEAGRLAEDVVRERCRRTVGAFGS